MKALSVLRSFVTRAATQTQAAAQVAISSASCDEKNRWIDVKWDDGKAGRFPFVWLRDNCPAEHSYYITPNSKNRVLTMQELDLNVRPDKMISEADGLQITWPGSKSAFYESKWLRERNISDSHVVERRKDVMLFDKQIWNREKISKRIRSHDFEKALNDQAACHDALLDLVEWGIVHFVNIKGESGQLQRLKEHLGYHHETHYGETFDVKVKVNPPNPSDTRRALELHTDIPYSFTPPDIQMLHCIENHGSGSGGESVFSDGFNVAAVIAKTRPDLYKILCEVQIEYVDEGADAYAFDTVNRWPVFNYEKDGRLDKVVFNNHMRSWFYDVGAETVTKVYEALKYFLDTAQAEENTFKTQLQGGQMIAFDNNRVMHGRSSFENSAEIQRHLQGMYFSWDTIKSRIRVLRDEMDHPKNQVSV